MIKASLRGPDGTTVLLGLSRENVRRLTAGQPIKVDLAELLPGAPAGASVAITFGETEQQIVDDMRAQLGTTIKVEQR